MISCEKKTAAGQETVWVCNTSKITCAKSLGIKWKTHKQVFPEDVSGFVSGILSKKGSAEN